MPITILLPSVLAPQAEGHRTLDASGSTVGEAITDVVARFPALGPRLRDEQGNLYPFVTLYLNDEDVRFLGGFEATVREGDELSVVPAVAGG
jgi:molybdopterin converting factor small subunit